MPRENLLAPSTIKLFGRVMTDLQFNYDPQTLVSGYNNLLQRQLANGNVTLAITGTTTANPAPPPANLDVVSQVSTMIGLFPGMTVSAQYNGQDVFSPGTVILSIGPGNSFIVSQPALIAQPAISIIVKGTDSIDMAPTLARIYSFAFEGAYYALPRPSIFLVHGNGNPVGNWNTPSTLEQSGVMGREWDFSGNLLPNDIAYWEYERGDFSIRLDPEAGPFDQILLASALRAGADMADRSGANLGVRSGANLSGANLSGANLSGANLAGANLRSGR